MLIQIYKSKEELFFDRYDILIDQKLEYEARSALGFLFPEMRIYNKKGRRFARIIKLYNEIKVDHPRYDIVFKYHLNVRFTTITTGQYKVFQDDALFDVVEQHDKLAVFLKKKQVALICMKNNPSFEEEDYKIVFDNNFVDTEILIGLILSYDNYFSKTNQSDNGKRFKNDINFDCNWTSKNDDC